MATEVPNQNDQSVTSLVTGIVKDFQDLVKQQLRLMRREIETDLRNSKQVVSLLAIGWGACAIGAIAVCLTVAHLLHWLGMPQGGGDVSALPLWGSFAITACLFFLGGGLAIVAAKKKFDATSFLHDTARALEEDLEWKTRTSRS